MHEPRQALLRLLKQWRRISAPKQLSHTCSLRELHGCLSINTTPRSKLRFWNSPEPSLLRTTTKLLRAPLTFQLRKIDETEGGSLNRGPLQHLVFVWYHFVQPQNPIPAAQEDNPGLQTVTGLIASRKWVCYWDDKGDGPPV